MSKHWFVAQTQPNKELVAQTHLEQQGFQSFLPLIKKIRRHARKVETVLRPLFPSYIFVALDLEHDQWRSINGTRGINYLLCHDDIKPAAIPNSVMDPLIAEQQAEGVIGSASFQKFMIGEQARLTEGAFKEETVTIETLNDRERVTVLLNFLNRELKVTVPLTSLEKLE
jgi:transcriptional antiterminator RfaH